MKTKTRDTFTTIRTEGAILPPDLLVRVSGGDKELGGLDPASYHLSGETINEAASRSWNRLLGAWTAFKERREALPEGESSIGMTRERWLLPLFEELRYGRLRAARAVEIEGKGYPVSHDWYGTPIHLVGFRTDLDRRTPGVAGAARTSPHGLVQELLNRSDERLWAFLSNGLRLRILRDNVSLTRQSYVEFDLEAMMDGEVYPDFVLLWLLCHQSRVEVPEGQRPEECHLEKWSRSAAERGTRALEGLRGGVEEAINALGSGFLRHRANEDLRAKLRSGDLKRDDYYRQLLRTVYRMLFLFVAEDRSLLLHPDADPKAAERYTRFYSTARLRNLAGKRVGTRHSDLYEALSLVLGKLGDDDGYPELGLPALGGFLFDEGAVPDLSAAALSNRDLLDAVRALSLVDYDGARRAVDYKNLGAEELGSVYESLLELHPVLDAGAGTFALETASGNERKTTGSYYTPDSLVGSLLDTALDPVLEKAAKEPDPERAILDLKVCDPAVGSGHFLIRAGHRIARRLAAIRTGDREPAPEPYREALREVISNCLYGVDVNLMAAELCRFNLLLEGIVPGKPLSFLDHHVQVGNSLLGTTPDLVHDGIPDDAFKPIEGDDRTLTSAYRRRNREERKQWEAGQRSFSLRTLDANQEAIEQGYAGVEEGEEDSVAAVREKAARYAALRESADYGHQRLIFDAWCAAFVWPKADGAPEAITQADFGSLTENPEALSRRDREEVDRIAHRYGFFHWDLAFPNVFERDGFDVVLGNPPWKRIKLQEQEWFAVRRPEISAAPNAAARKRMIRALIEEDPALHAAFREDLRKADGESHLIRSSGRYPLCGRGDVNTFAIFAESNRSLICGAGRAGFIVQSDIATANTYKHFFENLLSSRQLISFYDFVNTEGLFPNVHRTHPHFCLLTIAGSRSSNPADFAFWNTNADHLREVSRHVSLTIEDLLLLNPNTRTCPIFRSRRDAEITKSIYSNSIVLKDEINGGGWEIDFLKKMIDFTIHRELLCELVEDGAVRSIEGDESMPAAVARPVYEAKLLHQYDHRYATYLHAAGPMTDVVDVSQLQKRDSDFSVSSRYWIRFADFQQRVRERPINFRGILSIRGITNTTNERTTISCIRPFSPAFNSVGNAFVRTAADATFLCACLNSFPADYVSRQKLGGANLDPFVFFQLALVSPETAASPCPWDQSHTAMSFVGGRAFELTYTAWDLEPFARDLGYRGPPFRWDPERRFLLRCELDAAFFHLYGIGRDDADYIMETFPIVKRKDEAAHGEYRTKRVILEIYDQLARAAETGQPYRTPLDPLPVDLAADEPRQATVTPLRPRTEPQPESAPSLPQAAEERDEYVTQPPVQEPSKPEDSTNGATEPAPPEPSLLADTQPQLMDDSEIPARDGRAVPEVPNLYEAALALTACLPDGKKVEREALLAEAARELGHPRLTKKVRSALNKALNAEHSKGRLKTDWKVVWKPRK